LPFFDVTATGRRATTVRARRSPLLALTLCGVILAALVPSAAHAATTFRLNLYRGPGYITQDPYYTACTAASAMMMLNFIALSGTGGKGFGWRTSRVKNSATNYRDLTSIYWWERAHDTLAIGAKGLRRARLAERAQPVRLGLRRGDRPLEAGL
jgi:hypothetical protein